MKSSSRGVSSFLGSLFGGSAEPAASAAGSACATRSTRRVDESRSAGRAAGPPSACASAAPCDTSTCSTRSEDGDKGDALAALLRWARADGSFDPAGVDRELGLSARPEWPADEAAQRIYATACALHALRERFAADKPTWVLVHDKAARWLERCGVGLDRTLE